MPNFMRMFTSENPWGATASLFPQNRLLRDLPDNHPSKQGICRALCMVYCAMYKSNKNFGEAIGADIRGDDAKKQGILQALSNYASKLQETVNVGAASNILGATIWQLRQDITQLQGLAVLENECKALKWPCAKEIANEAIILANVGKYYLVWLPNHVICMRATEESAYLYDPNCGQIKCPRSNFPGLAWIYLTMPAVRLNYGLVAGVDIYLSVLW